MTTATKTKTITMQEFLQYEMSTNPAAEIQDILMEGLIGCHFLDPFDGALYQSSLVLGHGIGILEDGPQRGDVHLCFYIDKEKLSEPAPEWPREVLGVPITYEFRERAQG